MATFAVIGDNNVVSNIIVADSKEVAESVTGFTCVEYGPEDKVSIGSIFDGKNFTTPEVKDVEA